MAGGESESNFKVRNSRGWTPQQADVNPYAPRKSKPGADAGGGFPLPDWRARRVNASSQK